MINNQLKSLEDYGLRNINTYESMFGSEFKDFFKINLFSAQSRWYSNSKSLEIMKNYSDSKNIKYDYRIKYLCNPFPFIDSSYVFSSFRNCVI